MAYSFGLKTEKVLPIGLPRNDVLLFKPSDTLRDELSPKGGQIVMWLPTHRRSSTDASLSDGLDTGNIFNLPDFDIQKINDALAQAGATAVLKPHPMSAKCSQDFDLKNYPNIKIIDQKWLTDRNTTLGEMLALSDCLITDASSVIIDYLLLDRPIICHFPDINEYKTTRGFCWDFEPESYNIPLVESQASLLSVLQKALKNPDEHRPTEAFKKLCHNSTSRFSYQLLSYLNIVND